MAHCRRYDIGAQISGLNLITMVHCLHAVKLSLCGVLRRLIGVLLRRHVIAGSIQLCRSAMLLSRLLMAGGSHFVTFRS